MRGKLEITIGGCVLVAVALCVGDVLEAQVGSGKTTRQSSKAVSYTHLTLPTKRIV